jgi:hypothetical protein
MKRIILLLVAFATFSCTSNAKNKFSKALSTTLLATDGNFIQKYFKKYKGKTLVIEGFLVRRLCKCQN